MTWTGWLGRSLATDNGSRTACSPLFDNCIERVLYRPIQQRCRRGIDPSTDDTSHPNFRCFRSTIFDHIFEFIICHAGWTAIQQYGRTRTERIERRFQLDEVTISLAEEPVQQSHLELGRLAPRWQNRRMEGRHCSYQKDQRYNYHDTTVVRCFTNETDERV